MRRMPDEIRAYLDRLAPLQRRALVRLRRQILDAAPQAEERMSYGIPAFFFHGRLAYMAAFRRHASFFAMYAGATIASKNPPPGVRVRGSTIMFDPAVGLPEALVRRIIRQRMRENTGTSPRAQRPGPVKKGRMDGKARGGFRKGARFLKRRMGRRGNVARRRRSARS
jgi:uncharacterized protein YdhG (YjbR/CyaY superfamily)